MSDTPEQTEVEVGPDDNIEVSPLSQQQLQDEETGGLESVDRSGTDDENTDV